MASELIAAIAALLAVAVHPLVSEPAASFDALGIAIALLAVLPLPAVTGCWVLGMLRPSLSFARWRTLVLFYRQHTLVLFLAMVFGFDWPRAVDELMGGASWENGFVALAPYLLLRAQQWLFEVPLLRFLGDTRDAGRLIGERARAVLVLLIPLVVYDGLLEAVAGHPTAGVWLETVEAAWWGVNMLVVLLLIAALPFFVRWSIGATSLPNGPLRDLLSAFGRRLDVRFRDILLWDTGGRMPNAAVIGFWQRTRYVLFTDALLARLQPTEILAVLGHEAGHVKYHHFIRYLLVTVTFLLGADVAIELSGLGRWVVASWGESGVAVMWISVLVIYWRFVFGWFSRRFEQEADVYGARAVGMPEAFAAALDRIAGVGTHARRKRTWRYFSIDRRIDFVRRLDTDPTVIDRFERFMRRMMRLVLAVGVVVIAAGAWMGWQSFLLDRGAFLLQVAEPEEAITALEAAPRDTRRNGLRRDVYLVAAWLEAAPEIAKEDPERAAELRRRAGQRLQALVETPLSPYEAATLERLLAEWERQTDRPQAAAERLAALIESEQGRPSDRRERAKDLLAAGEEAAAAETYEQAIEGLPESSEVPSWLVSDLDDTKE